MYGGATPEMFYPTLRTYYPQTALYMYMKFNCTVD